MATKTKELDKSAVKAIFALSVPATKRRPPTDEEATDALATLAKHVGAKTAALPSWVRRIVVHAETGAPLLLVDGQHQPLSTTIWPLALPMASACELLASAQNPELALQARLDRDAAKAAAEKAQAANTAEARKLRREAEARLQRDRDAFRASDYELLCGWQRLTLQLAMAVATESPKLASAIRATLAQSLSGADADFPRSEWWPGLGLEDLDDAARRIGTQLTADERLQREVGAIPEGQLRTLRLMHGNDQKAIVSTYKLWEMSRREMPIHAPARTD